MGSIAHGVRWAVDALLRPFDALPPMAALVAVSVLTGVALLGVVKIATRQAAVARSRDRMTSAIYEIRLFLDQPRQVLLAQGRFLVASGGYLLHMLPALLVVAAPLGLLYLDMETRFGLEPLRAGQPIVVRIDLADGVDGDQVTVAGGDGVRVTAPQLYDRPRQRVYARIAIDEPRDTTLRVDTPGGSVDKRLIADPDARRVSPERSGGIATLWSYGNESALPDDAGIDRISVPHTDRSRSWLWMPWWLTWLLIATVAALVLKRPLRVEL